MVEPVQMSLPERWKYLAFPHLECYREGTVAELEAMTLPECWKYLRLLQRRYSSGSRRQRSGLLDEAEHVTGRHRKSLIRLLRGRLTHKPRTRQRGRSYGPQVEYAVRLIARSLDFPCAQRLQPALAARPGNGSPRSYDRPQPAFDRLCTMAAFDAERQATLADLRRATNPLHLRNEVHAPLDRLVRLPNARAGRPQDVRRTLFQHAGQHQPAPASVTLSIEGSFPAR